MSSSLRGLTKYRSLLKTNNAGVVVLLKGTRGEKCLGMSPLMIFQSHFHMETLSKNMQLYTNDKVTVDKNNRIQDCDGSQKPLTMLYSWTLSKDRHVRKFVKFYTDRGISVLRVKTLPYDLLFPKHGGQIVAGTILDFLKINPCYGQIFVHGFSVGAYAFGELMLKVSNDKEKEEILNRFVGQVWDSAVDVHGLPEALSRAFTSNHMFQMSLENYLKWYMKTNKEDFTSQLEKAASHIYDNTVNVPGLWIYSEADPVSPPSMNIQVYSKWLARGDPTYVKCFKHSKHVSHYYKYSDEYEDLIINFGEQVGMFVNDQQRKVAIKN